MKRLKQCLPLLLILVPSLAFGQITNGDFEAGGTGWTPVAPSGWMIDFPNTGGNPDGYAQIHSPFGNSGGIGCVSQIFDCGVPGTVGTCTITVDYQHETWDASPLAGRVKIFIDGTLLYTSPPEETSPWRTVTFAVDCGRHQIDLCLEVDPGNNGWQACFDNVTAHCEPVIPVELSTWGSIKALYR